MERIGAFSANGLAVKRCTRRRGRRRQRIHQETAIPTELIVVSDDERDLSHRRILGVSRTNRTSAATGPSKPSTSTQTK